MITIDGGYVPPVFVGDDDVTQHITNIVEEGQRSKKIVVDTIDFSGRALLVRKRKDVEFDGNRKRNYTESLDAPQEDISGTYANGNPDEELTVIRVRSGLTADSTREKELKERPKLNRRTKSLNKENIYKKVYITTRKIECNGDRTDKDLKIEENNKETDDGDYIDDFEELLAIRKQRTNSVTSGADTGTLCHVEEISSAQPSKKMEEEKPATGPTLSSRTIVGRKSENLHKTILTKLNPDQKLSEKTSVTSCTKKSLQLPRKSDGTPSNTLEFLETSQEGTYDILDQEHYDTTPIEKTLFQDYFDRSYRHRGATTSTSHNTLEKLPAVSTEQLDEALKFSLSCHEKERRRLMTSYFEQFGRWYSELHSGFNLIMYGLGSKRHLLLEFGKKVLTDGPVMVFDGFHPACDCKQLWEMIMDNLIPPQLGHPSKHWLDQSEHLRSCFNKGLTLHPRLYLILNNIDGLNLRSDSAQTALSVLASIPNIHTIASVDHIHADFMWDAIKTARYNWIWHSVPTFEPYVHEASYETSIMAMTGSRGLRGICHVLKSLTSNSQGIFYILAKHQLQFAHEVTSKSKKGTDSSTQHHEGLAHDLFLEQCRESFLVNSETGFRAHLTELLDHKIFVKRRSEGTDYYSLPLDSSSITKLMETLQSDNFNDDDET